jgi:hypothetical protein
MLETNIDEAFASDEVDLGIFESYGRMISDNAYFDFMSKLNGGFFYERSLHMYSFSKGPAFHNMEYINSIFQHEYGKLAQGHVFFAQDTLGNQFSFTDKGIAMFNCETAEIELLARSFDEWKKVLYNDLDYLTGRQLLRKWITTNSFDFDQRLCAKKPFVLGGEYNVLNLYAQYFPTYIASNANVAKQIHDLPDGAQVSITVVE